MSSNSDSQGEIPSSNLRWLDGAPSFHSGTTFGHPWPRGKYHAETTRFTCFGQSGVAVPVQSWILAYWNDGSIKWSAHAIPASVTVKESYSVLANVNVNSDAKPPELSPVPEVTVEKNTDRGFVEVKTGKISVRFSTSGRAVIQRIATAAGEVTGRNGRLVLLSQSSISSDYSPDPATKYFEFEGRIDDVVVEQSGPVRAVIAVRGKHHNIEPDGAEHEPWLPFTLRFYLYANSDAIRVIHTIMYDGDMYKDFIRGIGVRFDVPLEGEAVYDRHIRIAGSDDGILSEAVQGITGLRRDPGLDIRKAQIAGKSLPPLETWDPSVTSRLQWVPSWNDYSLSQLSPDSFTIRKRTKAGHSWVNIPGSGTRAGCLAYLGGATKGGIALGHRNFWERYPTGIDVRNAAGSTGEITMWLYSPSAEPMDMRPYHDGLKQDSYDKQLDALNITYEDWEPGTGTPHGIARTNELFIFSFDKTPDNKTINQITEYTQNPPVLVPDSEIIYQSKAFGNYWSPAAHLNPLVPEVHSIQSNLEFIFQFYQSQISQRKWYGFWDHGDIMHTYDEDRHTWRYDIGGYAWDNSELSPDIWLWLYFLQTGRSDVYRMAEALTRHTGEVDVYHLGEHKGLGTRHGVQHWSDSCKQARISNALYRKYFYYLSGGDERVGELLQEVLEAEKTFLILDPYRKVRKDKETYRPDANALYISLGTDWSALASAWIIEYERRGPKWQEAEMKLSAAMKGIAGLANGFVTGNALYNMTTGEISPPPQDPENRGIVQISHLSAMFGLFEVCAELLDIFPAEVTKDFEKAWMEYCRYFNGTSEEQIERFGVSFGKLQLRQGHSRLTAFAASRLGDRELARRAWQQFRLEAGYGPEGGYGPETSWTSTRVDGSDSLSPVDEAAWISTNITALYGIAAIQNLALIGEALER